MRRFMVAITVVTCISVSCMGTQPAPSPSPTVDNVGGATAASSGASEPTIPIAESSAPQRIEFPSTDGVNLVGTYWPTLQQESPGVLLMHWNPGTREDWALLAALLQGSGVAGSSPGRVNYAVFAFDFRGHGESEGSPNSAGYLEDARAAFALFQNLPGVDSTRIILIGASIGADAAVDACGTGCLGAVSISPGDYLGVSYVDALGTMGDKPVLCVAAREDHPSPETCDSGLSVGLSDYQEQFYAGKAHGMEVFAITEEEPALIDLIFLWLDSHFPKES